MPAAAIGAGGTTSSIRRYHQSLGSVLAAWRLWTRPRAEENVIVILHPPTQRVLTLIRREDGGDPRQDGLRTDRLSTHIVPSRLLVFASGHTPKTKSREGTAPASARTLLAKS